MSTEDGSPEQEKEKKEEEKGKEGAEEKVEEVVEEKVEEVVEEKVEEVVEEKVEEVVEEKVEEEVEEKVEEVVEEKVEEVVEEKVEEAADTDGKMETSKQEVTSGLLDDIKTSEPVKEYAGVSSASPESAVEMNLPVQETDKEGKVDQKVSPHFIEEPVFDKTIFAIKTAIGHEKMVANRIAGRARKRKAKIYSILAPTKLRGYLLIEGEKNIEAIQDLLRGVQHAHSVIGGEADLGEIEHFLTPKPLVSGIAEGDIVEIVSGPFKGEKARVQQIDESKEEITMELFDALVSIPVTIRGDAVRVLEKESED